MMTSLVRKSAPIVALYEGENFSLTYDSTQHFRPPVRTMAAYELVHERRLAHSAIAEDYHLGFLDRCLSPGGGAIQRTDFEDLSTVRHRVSVGGEGVGCGEAGRQKALRHNVRLTWTSRFCATIDIVAITATIPQRHDHQEQHIITYHLLHSTMQHQHPAVPNHTPVLASTPTNVVHAIQLLSA